MVFSRLFFIYLFFPICFLCYFATKKTSYRNAVLIVFSLLFYACGDISFLWLVVASALVNFVLGRGIDKFRDKAPAKAFLALGLVLNLGTLVGFKYTGFFIENLNNWFSLSIPVPDLPLPLGISFFTFRTVSYLIDCAWGKVKAERNFFTFLLYVSFFPITISGPIARYETMQADLHQRRVSADDLSIGFGRIAVGLGKKVILADRLSGIVDQFLGNDFTTQTTLGVWYGVILYALQMYFDFSGYSDMAIGMGRCLGFHFNENFRHPYCCTSITDFWRRWHISLGSFFRDYVYIPMGGNRRHQAFNILVVWFLTGMWHGASWNFILWGLYFGVIVMLEKYTLLRVHDRIPRFVLHVYSLLLVIIGWGIFYFDNFDSMLIFFNAFIGQSAALTDFVSQAAITDNFWLWVMAIIFCMPLRSTASALLARMLGRSSVLHGGAVLCVRVCISLVMLMLSVALLVGATNNAFIYTRF